MGRLMLCKARCLLTSTDSNARFQDKKTAIRRYKEEYCDSCFYRGQP